MRNVKTVKYGIETFSYGVQEHGDWYLKTSKVQRLYQSSNLKKVWKKLCKTFIPKMGYL